ncbi:MAG: glutamate--cysteine ligase [Burkholderiaceae bacterium]|nr:glutamate--cysteine ligase [Burkholderiaceae bacterium]
MVPHLQTALKGPLLDLERRILDATPRIERWFRLEWQEHTPPFYCSVDLRNAGFKIAPIDTNLFPAGFDLLSREMLPLAVQAAMAAIEKYCPDARNLLLIPQRGATDPAYLTHLARLASVLRQTGLHVRFGNLDAARGESVMIELPDGGSLRLEPLVRQGRRLGLDGFDPCSILLNDDLATGEPAILDGLHEQVLLPPLHAGWRTRRKSNHVAAYAAVSKRFAKLIDVDPWLIGPAHVSVAPANLLTGEGEARLVRSVDTVLRQVRAKYRELRIRETPFVVLKPDAGSHGADVVTLRSTADVRALPHDARLRLSAGADDDGAVGILVQEGVHTMESVEGASSEPVVYMVDRFVVGGYYRTHARRNRDESLDAPGGRIVPLPFDSSCLMPDASAGPEAGANRFYAYGVIARLALLAAAIELEQTDPDQSLYG